MSLFRVERKNKRVRGYFLGIRIFSVKFLSRTDRVRHVYQEAHKRVRLGIDSETDRRMVLEYQFAERGNTYPLNLDAPRTFNEKLNWLKLNYKDSLVTQCSDKVGMREYVARTVGEKYLVPAIGVFDSVDDIDFASLPQRFALKVNWGSGQNIICENKADLNWTDCYAKIRDWMKPESNHYCNFLEWGYKDIEPKILVEEFIEHDGSLPDYKFMCYGGDPKNMFIVENRELGKNRMTVTFFDSEFRKLPFERMYHRNEGFVSKPAQWDEMMELSRKLSAPFPFVRVDFYITKTGAVKVGEMTFCPGAGHEPFSNYEWDLRLGDMIELPKESR